MEYRRMNRKTGFPVKTHTPYAINPRTGIKDTKKRVLTQEMKDKYPSRYLYIEVGDEL